ncbi:hypothetical protein, variant 2 [Blastomyces gilchristii SLH14081]|uniref:Uncharacterized protein n=1 Tax=Blastomyces gilchristii (strain SLH14081) TaxID=559298 RepID=A0A179UZS5_BLAGS|nr:uncharacterized protein BDBG_08766 [Blastomyces gilchristii SLH14081]XP_031580994.1 hypothetical protein, variant 1 [Blastomyces gilchristii SLH14081]XP_031580995.1 hypothetical protein, variant 2 [Blastomyces gilchristii SLH14081]OAT13593.1 hypothetical protein BDBG_08766 [Blastomyces gilchristii SLH14081]OAT13594.1 hypothetical protein, variant 1 [Blastomyces gilchristii SLH14081]OAT13595.1 hypothetical protein, variant 2 [Blastomyces gilchristii SLH14081]
MFSAMTPPSLLSVDPITLPSSLSAISRPKSAQNAVYDQGDFNPKELHPHQYHHSQELEIQHHRQLQHPPNLQHQPPSIELEMSDLVTPGSTVAPRILFGNLPTEIHESILDHLFGVRGSTLASLSPIKSSANSWSKALRHPRRKALSDLALVSSQWRPLVQERIYRHIQVKGTADGLLDCSDWFLSHSHLSAYVRHIEIWIPVWGDRMPKGRPRHYYRPHNGIEDSNLASVASVLQATVATFENTSSNSASTSNFRFSSRNATLQQIFCHVSYFFPHARILTLEGGHCKKPPMIRHFDNDPWGQSGEESLEVLPNIQTFVMRGAWNIMRDYRHWCNLAKALPNLREWDCAYAKRKLEAHVTISKALANFPRTITRLDISLEGFYNKASSHSRWFGTVHAEPHLCQLLGAIAPQLESLTFTGKVCACLFKHARAAMLTSHAASRLKSVDLVVKSCCREQPSHDDGSPMLNDLSGITNINFINSFEKLVVAAVRSLDAFVTLNHMRIRFIDLDSASPLGLLNPYFQLVDNKCIGLWSETILDALHGARQHAEFELLDDGILPQYGINVQTASRVFPRTRPLSIKASSYKIIADKSKL